MVSRFSKDKITPGQSKITLDVQAHISKVVNVLKPHLTKLSLSAESIVKPSSIVTSTPGVNLIKVLRV